MFFCHPIHDACAISFLLLDLVRPSSGTDMFLLHSEELKSHVPFIRAKQNKNNTLPRKIDMSSKYVSPVQLHPTE